MIDAHRRILLAERLAVAAELEHGLVCQYLFAAFSMRRYGDDGVTLDQLELMRQWEAAILTVARQEMEHLGIVNNMLTAIGESPRMERPNFPLAADYYKLEFPFKLQRLCPEALERFVAFEMPSKVVGPDKKRLGYAIPDLVPQQNQTIGNLYDEILALFTELGAPGDGLWIGPPSAQLTNKQVLPVPVVGVSLAGRSIYDIRIVSVSDLESAREAIAQILEEGEGTPVPSDTSHYQRFLDIREQLAQAQQADPRFDPARPVVDNPSGKITDPDTLAVSGLFDLAYGTMMLMLIRFFAQAGHSRDQLAALQATAFFPLMTTVIRPLGEILTQLPAGAEYPGLTAGPTFEFTPSLSALPHNDAALKIIVGQLDQLAADALGLSDRAAYSTAICGRLGLVHENVARMAMNFRNATGMPLPA